jgi:hypothetical protein
MREIRTLRSMSGKRKRSAGFDTKPTSPRLFSTLPQHGWHVTSEPDYPQPATSGSGN